MIARLVRSAPALVLAFTALACGGGDGDTVSAEDWAKSVCSDIKDIEQRIEDETQNLGNSIDPNDPAGAKDAVVELLETLEGTMGDARQAFEEAGTPDVDGGEELADDIQQAFTDAEEAIGNTVDDARDIPTDDPAALATEMQKIGQSLQENTDLEGTFDDLEDRFDETGLKDQFEDQKECEGLDLIS